jgi:hypothetical protein
MTPTKFLEYKLMPRGRGEESFQIASLCWKTSAKSASPFPWFLRIPLFQSWKPLFPAFLLNYPDQKETPFFSDFLRVRI